MTSKYMISFHFLWFEIRIGRCPPGLLVPPWQPSLGVASRVFFGGGVSSIILFLGRLSDAN